MQSTMIEMGGVPRYFQKYRGQGRSDSPEHVEDWSNGCSFFAYNWKLTAAIEFFAYNRAYEFLLTVGASLLTVGAFVSEHINGLYARKLNRKQRSCNCK